MALIRWQPFQEMEHLRRQMDQMFDELTGFNRGYETIAGWKPAVELEEIEDRLILRAEVPGIEAKDLDIDVSRDAVAIRGEHRYGKKTEDKGFFRSELRYGKFERIINLPVEIEQEKVQAEFKNGILTLTLPKVEDTRRNVVKVNVVERI
ncbi:MAG: Hsp20/alpha crystallin family protein [Xenococcaceae cyanobacterium]